MRTAILAAGGLIVGALAALAVFPQAREKVLPSAIIQSTGKALVGGPFTLKDQTGKVVTDKDFRGRYMLVFFGFTNCPDVCPTALQVMSAALEKLGPKADRIVPIFISVDFDHDGPKELAGYVQSFDRRLVGLSGTQEQIEAAAKAYRVYFKKVPDPKATTGYTIDHSAIIYLMGPDGAFVTHFTHTTDPDALADRLAKLL
ncbi:MAG: SCO family protein [Hyphomicrobiaceae bacterium]|jgi:protein SCO1/2